MNFALLQRFPLPPPRKYATHISAYVLGTLFVMIVCCGDFSNGHNPFRWHGYGCARAPATILFCKRIYGMPTRKIQNGNNNNGNNSSSNHNHYCSYWKIRQSVEKYTIFALLQDITINCIEHSYLICAHLFDFKWIAYGYGNGLVLCVWVCECAVPLHTLKSRFVMRFLNIV